MNYSTVIDSHDFIGLLPINSWMITSSLQSSQCCMQNKSPSLQNSKKIVYSSLSNCNQVHPQYQVSSQQMIEKTVESQDRANEQIGNPNTFKIQKDTLIVEEKNLYFRFKTVFDQNFRTPNQTNLQYHNKKSIKSQEKCQRKSLSFSNEKPALLQAKILSSKNQTMILRKGTPIQKSIITNNLRSTLYPKKKSMKTSENSQELSNYQHSKGIYIFKNHEISKSLENHAKNQYYQNKVLPIAQCYKSGKGFSNIKSYMRECNLSKKQIEGHNIKKIILEKKQYRESGQVSNPEQGKIKALRRWRGSLRKTIEPNTYVRHKDVKII